MSLGRLFVFSGLDGAGKSTQIERLIKDFQLHGRQPIYLWTRGGYTPFFSFLKMLLHRLYKGKALPPPGPSSQRTEAFNRTFIRRFWLLLALLDLLWLFGVQLRWWRWRGKIIICDRYLWDTLIDFRLNFPQEAVENWLAWRLLARVTLKPDIAFLLLVPVEESLRRSTLKNEPFPDSPDVLAKRLAHYQTLAKMAHWIVLDGQCSIDQLAQQIQLAVKPLAEAKMQPDHAY